MISQRFTFTRRLPQGDVPGGFTVHKTALPTSGDFTIQEYIWGDLALWFVEDDEFSDDERQEAYELFLRLRIGA